MSSFKFKSTYKETVYTARAKGNYFIEVSFKNSLGEEYFSEYSKEEAETYIKNGIWIVLPSVKPFNFYMGSNKLVYTAEHKDNMWEVTDSFGYTTNYTEQHVKDNLEFGSWVETDFLTIENDEPIQSSSTSALGMMEKYCDSMGLHVTYARGGYVVGHNEDENLYYNATNEYDLFNLLDCLETIELAKIS